MSRPTSRATPREAGSDGQAFIVLARPEGSGRALATYYIPIEGRDEWLEAAQAADRPA